MFLSSRSVIIGSDALQVTFPNGVFSGTIISSVIHNGDIKKTAEWQLLLGALALPGVFVGAFLCNRFGRRNTVRSQLDLMTAFMCWCSFLADDAGIQRVPHLRSHHRMCL